MTTAATSLLGLALPVTGELSGTWGDTVNNAITTLLDDAVAGTTTLSVDADVTLSTTALTTNEARQAIILWTAGGTVTRYITAPAQSKVYAVLNKTSSTQSIVIRGDGPTTGVTVLAGKQAMVAWDGTDFVEVSTGYVDGPASATNNAIALFDGTSGKLLKNSATLLPLSALVGISDIQSLTNKTVQARVVVIADATSITVNADTTDVATQANTQALGTLTVNAPTGTLVNGQKFILRLQSNNVQTFSWNSAFQGSTDIALPTASSGSGLYDYVGFIYNSTSAKWQMIAKVFGF